MSKQLAPICRILQRPVPGSPLGPGTYLTLLQRPGCLYTYLLLGERRQGLRAAIQAAATHPEAAAHQPPA